MNNIDECVGEVVDLFCGVGGVSHGFKRVGFRIVAGYDVDEGCRYAFENNNDSRFVAKDLRKVTAREIKERFSRKVPSVLVGCAPCQPFSTYKKGQVDDRWSLLKTFAEIALKVEPDFVSMENVAGLMEYRDGQLFSEFIEILQKKYHCYHKVVDCTDFGVPQRRKRLVVIASKTRRPDLTYPELAAPATVKNAIKHLDPLEAGELSDRDPLHRCSRLSTLNLKRIRASKPGGTWRDWPPKLVTKCHRAATGKGYGGVYGRMEWDKAAPTITTQCYGYGNGRFGHPTQDRGMSLREAAILQTFPESYRFFEEGKFPGFKAVGRWIGNAVPVLLAENIARSILTEIEEIG